MSDLGPVVSTHEGRLAAGGFLWPIGGVLLLSGPALLVRGVASGDPAGLVEGLGSFALATGVGALLVLYAYALRAQRIVAHQHGLVWTRFLRAPFVLRWDQIADVRMRTTYGGRGSFHLKGQHVELEVDLRDGRSISITNDLDRVEELRGYMMSSSQPRVAPAPSPWG